MMITRSPYISFIVLCCIMLHYTWAYLIWMDPVATHSTALAAVTKLFHSTDLLKVVLVITSTQALLGMYLRFPWNVWMMFPQQGILLISAAGAIDAIYDSNYADGVARPREFIAADQAMMVFATFWHAMAIMAIGYRSIDAPRKSN